MRFLTKIILISLIVNYETMEFFSGGLHQDKIKQIQLLDMQEFSTSNFPESKIFTTHWLNLMQINTKKPFDGKEIDKHFTY